MPSIDPLSPIYTVNGTVIPTPSEYQFNVQDVSAPNAGRTEDGMMHKDKIGQCVKLECKWQNITTSALTTLLSALDSEYLTVVYLNPKRGGYYTGTFYAGDRTAPCYSAKLGIWSTFSCNLIERSATANGGTAYVSS